MHPNKCLMCGKVFTPRFNQRQRHCSPKCREESEWCLCAVCGIRFKPKTKGYPAKTCSTDCLAKLSSRTLKNFKIQKWGEDYKNNPEYIAWVRETSKKAQKTIDSSPDKKKADYERRKNTMKNTYMERGAEIQEKRKKTIDKNGGQERINKNIAKALKKAHEERGVEIREKRETTLEERYNNKNYNNREKFKETILENFGSIEAAYSHIYSRAKETLIRVHGSASYNNHEKYKATSLEKYGYDNPSKHPAIKEKVRKTCEIKYNAPTNLVAPEQIEAVKAHYLSNYGVEHSSQIHIKDFKNLYNKDFITENFANKEGKIKFQMLMEHFNISSSKVWSILKELNLSKEPENYSKMQKFIYDFVETKNKIFNDRKVLGGKEIDIYLPDLKLGFEYCGALYHSKGSSKWAKFNNPSYSPYNHLNKLRLAYSKGVHLFHINEFDNLDLWLELIKKLETGSLFKNDKLLSNFIIESDEFIFLNMDFDWTYLYPSLNIEGLEPFEIVIDNNGKICMEKYKEGENRAYYTCGLLKLERNYYENLK